MAANMLLRLNSHMPAAGEGTMGGGHVGQCQNTSNCSTVWLFDVQMWLCP